MTVSMRRKRNELRKRKETYEQKRTSRIKAADMLRAGGSSIRCISSTTGVTKSVVAKIRKHLESGNESGLQAVLDPEKNRPGRKCILTADEEEMIVHRLIFASERGFAVDKEGLKYVMARVAADGRATWANYVPSDDAVRDFRCRHPELAFRNYEKKDNVKLKGENYTHVKTYADAFKTIDRQSPGIFNDGDRFWNLDETSIDPEFGKRIKVFGSSTTHHGGFRSSTAQSGTGKHVTAVVAVSASGRKCPPFFVVAGKHVMGNWFLPLSSDAYKLRNGEVHPLCKPDWFPQEGVVVCTEKGSMTSEIIPLLVKHLHNFVSKFLPVGTRYVLALDGHSSRKGLDWLELCIENKCDVVQSPANTSHFLQPCDQFVNKKFKTTIREVRDRICSLAVTDTKTIRFKLMCGVTAYESITVSDIRKSFDVTGLFPMDYRFLDRFHAIGEKHLGLGSTSPVQGDMFPQCAIASSNDDSVLPEPVEQKRETDSATRKDLLKILTEIDCPTKSVQHAAILMSQRETTNSILMNIRPVPSAKSCDLKNKARQKNFYLPSGAPAELLTVAAAMERRRKFQENQTKEQDAKNQRQKKKLGK